MAELHSVTWGARGGDLEAHRVARWARGAGEGAPLPAAREGARWRGVKLDPARDRAAAAVHHDVAGLGAAIGAPGSRRQRAGSRSGLSLADNASSQAPNRSATSSLPFRSRRARRHTRALGPRPLRTALWQPLAVAVMLRTSSSTRSTTRRTRWACRCSSACSRASRMRATSLTRRPPSRPARPCGGATRRCSRRSPSSTGARTSARGYFARVIAATSRTSSSCSSGAVRSTRKTHGALKIGGGK